MCLNLKRWTNEFTSLDGNWSSFLQHYDLFCDYHFDPIFFLRFMFILRILFYRIQRVEWESFLIDSHFSIHFLIHLDFNTFGKRRKLICDFSDPNWISGFFYSKFQSLTVNKKLFILHIILIKMFIHSIYDFHTFMIKKIYVIEGMNKIKKIFLLELRRNF